MFRKSSRGIIDYIPEKLLQVGESYSFLCEATNSEGNRMQCTFQIHVTNKCNEAGPDVTRKREKIEIPEDPACREGKGGVRGVVMFLIKNLPLAMIQMIVLHKEIEFLKLVQKLVIKFLQKVKFLFLPTA